MNKFSVTMSALLMTLGATGCQKGDSDEKIIEKPDIDIVDGKMTPEVLEAFGRISGAVPSPDGKTIAFTLAYENIELNKSNAEIYTVPAEGSEITRLTNTAASESNFRWIEDGKKIAIIRYDKETDASQIFTMNSDGSGEKRVSKIENGVECFEISPDGQKIVFASTIDAFNKDEKLFEGLPKTYGRVVHDLM